MNYVKLAIAVWVISVTTLAFIFERNLPGTTTTKIFCAYNRVFVEFEESNHRWGTIMIDAGGKPIPCKDNEELPVSEPVNTKEII